MLDLVVSWGGDTYPSVVEIVVSAGRRAVWVPVEEVTGCSPCRFWAARRRRWRRATWSGLAVGMQVLNGVITPALLVHVLVLANPRSVLGAAANGPVFRVMATVCVALIAVMATTVVVLRLTGVW